MHPLMVLVLLVRAPKNDVSTGEIIQGIAVLAVFLVVAYAIGKTGAWFKNRSFTSTWAPLVPVLGEARISSDGGVAVTSRLSGTYRGASVHALMSPNVAHKYGATRNGNVFSVAIENVAGAEDWSIEWHVGLPVVGTSSWVVRPTDTPLANRLESAAAVGHIEKFGRASTHYRVRDQTLEWSAYIEPRKILPPDQFGHVLDALLALVVINGTVNQL
jgi:hypothetical protein